MLVLATAAIAGIVLTALAIARLVSRAKRALKRPAQVIAQTKAIALVVNVCAILNTLVVIVLSSSVLISALVLAPASICLVFVILVGLVMTAPFVLAPMTAQLRVCATTLRATVNWATRELTARLARVPTSALARVAASTGPAFAMLGSWERIVRSKVVKQVARRISTATTESAPATQGSLVNTVT